MNTKTKLTLYAVGGLLTAAGFVTGYQVGQSSPLTVNNAADGYRRLPNSPPPSVRTAFQSVGPAATVAPAAKAEAEETTPPDQASIPRGMADALARDCLFGGPNSRPGQLSLAATTLLGLDSVTAAEINQTLADLTKRSLAIQRRHTTMVKNTAEEQVFETGPFHGDGGSDLETEMRAVFSARIGEERAAALLRSFPRPASEEGSHLGFGQRTLTFRLTPQGYNVRADYRSGSDGDSVGNSVEWNTETFPEEFRGLLAEEEDARAAK